MLMGFLLLYIIIEMFLAIIVAASYQDFFEEYGLWNKLNLAGKIFIPLLFLPWTVIMFTIYFIGFAFKKLFIKKEEF